MLMEVTKRCLLKNLNLEHWLVLFNCGADLPRILNEYRSVTWNTTVLRLSFAWPTSLTQRFSEKGSSSRHVFYFRGNSSPRTHMHAMYGKTVSVCSKLAIGIIYVMKNNLCNYFDANEKRHIKVTHISDILSVWGKQIKHLDKYNLTGAIQFVLYIALALKKIASKFTWIKFVSNATYKEGLISPLKTDHLTGCCSRDPHNLLTHASSA